MVQMHTLQQSFISKTPTDSGDTGLYSAGLRLTQGMKPVGLGAARPAFWHMWFEIRQGIKVELQQLSGDLDFIFACLSMSERSLPAEKLSQLRRD